MHSEGKPGFVSTLGGVDGEGFGMPGTVIDSLAFQLAIQTMIGYTSIFFPYGSIDRRKTLECFYSQHPGTFFAFERIHKYVSTVIHDSFTP